MLTAVAEGLSALQYPPDKYQPHLLSGALAHDPPRAGRAADPVRPRGGVAGKLGVFTEIREATGGRQVEAS